MKYLLLVLVLFGCTGSPLDRAAAEFRDSQKSERLAKWNTLQKHLFYKEQTVTMSSEEEWVMYGPPKEKLDRRDIIELLGEPDTPLKKRDEYIAYIYIIYEDSRRTGSVWVLFKDDGQVFECRFGYVPKTS